jgi:hypothetical protein
MLHYFVNFFEKFFKENHFFAVGLIGRYKKRGCPNVEQPLEGLIFFMDGVCFLGRYPCRLAAAAGRVLAGCRPRPCCAAGGSARCARTLSPPSALACTKTLTAVGNKKRLPLGIASLIHKTKKTL